jgi:amino acid transporter
MENILWGIIYLLCFAMAALCMIFVFKFIKEQKKPGRIKSPAEAIILSILTICIIGLIIVPILDMFGILK